MNNKLKILIILFFLFISFFLGLYIGQSNSSKPDVLITTNGQTFYATVTQIRENNKISVKGLEINDINYRGEFYFTIEDNTILTWRGINISVSDLNIGDNISITFSDEMLASIYPTPIENVEKIQLLDDEK